MKISKLDDFELPDNSYVVISKYGLDILKNIHIAGQEFKHLNRLLSENFLHASYQVGHFNDYRLKDLAELSILRSGNYYGLDQAFMDLANFSLPTAHLGCSRVLQPNGDFEAELYLKKTIMLKEAKHLLTSEIIASGSTFTTAFENIPRNIKEWTIYSVAAAREGCKLLKKLGEEYNIKINLFVNCFLGGLEKNGTDIPFSHPDSSMSKKVESELRLHYGNEFYEAVKCCIGDGGRRFCYPEKHYEEILELYSSRRFKDKNSQRTLEKIMEETRHHLRSLREQVYIRRP